MRKFGAQSYKPVPRWLGCNGKFILYLFRNTCIPRQLSVCPRYQVDPYIDIVLLKYINVPLRDLISSHHPPKQMRDELSQHRGDQSPRFLLVYG